MKYATEMFLNLVVRDNTFQILYDFTELWER